MIQKKILACLTGLILVFLTACGQGKNDGDVVVRYKGGVLTSEDLAAHGDLLARQSKYTENPSLLTPEFVYEHAVNMEMIIAKGLKENLHLDPRIRARLHEQMANLFLQVMQETLVPEINREQFTDEEVRAYFDENKEAYTEPVRYGIRVIVHDDPDTLSKLRKDILSGACTFEDAAKEYSMDKKNRDKGGDAGFRPMNRYRPEWQTVIETLKVTEISEPFIYKEKHYLLQVTDITEARLQSFEDRKTYVRNDLLYSKYRDAWEACYENLKNEFDVKINDHALDHFIHHKEAQHGDSNA